MNDGQIYQLCHQKPGIKATEIANVLKAELLVVSNALRSLVDVGDLVKSKKFDDETGRSSQVYELSEEFKRSRHFKDMLGMMNQVQTPAPTAPAKPVGEVVQAAPPVGTPGVVTESDGLSKVQRGVNFIVRFGAASAAELRAAMGLPHGASVASYLAPAIKNGRVHCDGKLWKSGTGQPAVSPAVVREKLGLDPVTPQRGAPAYLADQIAGKKVTGIIGDELHKAPAAPEPHIRAGLIARGLFPMPTSAAPPAAPFRCALWTDGVLEIHREEGVIRLTPGQTEELARLLHRDWEPV